MPIVVINDQSFAEVIKENEVVLVDFYADWCGPCKMIAPILEDLAKAGHVIAKLNVDESQSVAQSLGIVSIPTLHVYRNGELVNKHVGFAAKAQIETLLQ